MELGLSSLKMQQPFLLPVTCISTTYTVSLTRKTGLIPGLKVFADENPRFVLESCGFSAHCHSLLTDLSVAVIKHPDKEQHRRGEVLFVLLAQVPAPHC